VAYIIGIIVRLRIIPLRVRSRHRLPGQVTDHLGDLWISLVLRLRLGLFARLGRTAGSRDKLVQLTVLVSFDQII
jgi:hypothetical protein